MGLAALLVFIYHDWMYIFNGIPIFSEIEHFVSHTGNIGVDIFLFMSGIGLMYSIKEVNSTTEFYIHRIKRILLPALVTSLIVAIIKRWDLITYIKAISGYNFIFFSSTFFLWYFYAIVLLYLFFPAYYHFYKKIENKTILVFITLLIWCILEYLTVTFNDSGLCIFINRIPIFIFGTLLSENKNEHIFSFKELIIWIFIFATGVVLCVKCLNTDLLFIKKPILFLPYSILAISIVYLFSYVLELLNFKCIKKFLSFFGSVSFEFYCAQEIVINDIIYDSIVGTIPILYDVSVLAIEALLGYTIYKLNNKFWNLLSHT